MKRSALLLSVFLLAVSPLAYGARGKAVTSPGTYKAWGAAEIDQIEVVKTFAASSYDRIVVLPFETSKIEPKGGDAVVVQGALDGYTAVFVEGLRADIAVKSTKIEIAEKEKTPKSEKTLIVRGTVEELNPGSRAKRALAGMGAGAARNKVSVELVDAKSGDVLVRFTQAHRSAGTFKFAGGTPAQVMRDGTRAMGEDTAAVINAF